MELETKTLTTQTLEGDTVQYIPWTDGDSIGYKCVHANGVEEYIYLRPSINAYGVDNPNVFVYVGRDGDPHSDSAITFVRNWFGQNEGDV